MLIGLLFGLLFVIVVYKVDDGTRKWARRRREKRWPDLKQK